MDDMNLTSAPGMIPEDHRAKETDGPTWFGILFNDRSTTVKRYCSWVDYKEAGDSTFVRYTTRLFEAEDRKSALTKAVGMLKQRSLV